MEYQAGTTATVIDTVSGLGAGQVNGEFEETFFGLVDAWLKAYGTLPVILSGMVGSTIGWQEVPYSACPVNVSTLAAQVTRFNARGLDIALLAGLKTDNPMGLPDVMRGEELQLLGWYQSQAQPSGRSLCVLPGTHNKWVVMNNGSVETFSTGFCGELFALLKNHSVLLPKDLGETVDKNAFEQGVLKAKASNASTLLHSIFATRSLQLLRNYSAEQAASYLSGLLIGCDVVGALALFQQEQGSFSHLHLIGESQLSENYQKALHVFGYDSQVLPTQPIAEAAYTAIYEQNFLQQTA